MSFNIDDIKVSKELGEYLKNAREQAHISIEQIQKETKIRVRYLTAIENGDFSIIPGGDVYVKGFLKNYADSVGLESDTIIELYKKISELEEEKTPVKSLTQDTIKSDVFSSNLSDYARLNYKKMGVVILTIAILIFAIISIRAFRMRKPPRDVPPITQTPVKEDLSEDEIEKPPIEEMHPVVEDTEVMLEIVEDTSQNTVYVIDDDYIEVTINNITDRCWVLVYKDGNWDYEGILSAGESKSWRAENNINIRIGNPAVVNLVVNDKDLGSLTGKARNFIFKRRNF